MSYNSFVVDLPITIKTYPHLTPKCTLHFRPRGDGWENESFGFDWVRVGDSNAWCDNDGWRDDPKPDWHLAGLMGKYYKTGTRDTCDDLNGWTTMSDKVSSCNFENEVPIYNRLLQEFFPVRFQQRNEISSSSLASVPDDIKNAIEKSFSTYYVPIMMLRQGATANLTVLIRIDPSADIPKRIEITHTPSEGETSPFTITNGIIPSPSTGLNSKNISITCNATFSDFQTIDAYGIYDVDGEEKKALCGQLKVHPNDVIRRVNLLHVKVRLKVNGTTTTGRNLSNTELSKLKRVFNNQAMIDCVFQESTYELTIENEIFGETYRSTESHEKTELLDGFSTPPTPGITHQPPVVKETHAAITTVETTIERKIVGTNLITTTTTTTTVRLRFLLTGNAISSHDWLINDGVGGYIIGNKAGFNTLVLMAFEKDLRDCAATAPDGSPLLNINRYDNSIKIFTFNNAHQKASGITQTSNHTITLFTQNTNETFAHEVGHALGLPHSFVASERDPSAKFTYQAKKTNNIMDYSHMDGRKRYSLFYWQMQEMWRYIDELNNTSAIIPQQQSNEQEHTVIVKVPDTGRILRNEVIPIFQSTPRI